MPSNIANFFNLNSKINLAVAAFATIASVIAGSKIYDFVFKKKSSDNLQATTNLEEDNSYNKQPTKSHKTDLTYIKLGIDIATVLIDCIDLYFKYNLVLNNLNHNAPPRSFMIDTYEPQTPNINQSRNQNYEAIPPEPEPEPGPVLYAEPVYLDEEIDINSIPYGIPIDTPEYDYVPVASEIFSPNGAYFSALADTSRVNHNEAYTEAVAKEPSAPSL